MHHTVAGTLILGSDKMCKFVGGCSCCPSQRGLASRRHYWSPVVLYSYTGMEQGKNDSICPQSACKWVLGVVYDGYHGV